MSAVILLQYTLATLLPVAASALFYGLEQNTRFSQLAWMTRQIIIGLAFGLIAIAGTEFGIIVNGATVNVRDAAPLAAGLLFGGPAGIIAGVIGAVERWFAASWGRGVFTQLACSIATCAAGLYVAAFRRFLLDDKRPTWVMGLFIGTVVEVLHLMLIFLTNADMAQRAFVVVRDCAIPMTALNGISVMLSVIVVTLLSGEKLRKPPEEREISQSMQDGMIFAVVIAFICTLAFTFGFHTNLAADQGLSLFLVNLNDVKQEISDASNEQLLLVTRQASANLESVELAKDRDLAQIANRLQVSEINVVDETGVVVASSNPALVGFDMSSDKQSYMFMKLLGDDLSEYVQDYQIVSRSEQAGETEVFKYAAVALPDGFVQVGYNSEHLQRVTDQCVAGITHNRHVGELGSILIVNSDGVIVSSRDQAEGKTLEETGLASYVESNGPGTLFEGQYREGSVLAAYQDTKGYRIIAVEPISEAQYARNVAVLMSAFMEVLVFATLFVIIYILVKHLVVDNVHGINRTLGLITAGDLDATVNVRSNKEFASLSQDINATVDALKRAIAEAAARLDAELEYARTIQLSALPQVFPPFPNRHDFDIFACTVAAKEVGGDFYDFYLIDDEHLVFLIADVSGKGIPAALFMMRAKTTIKSLAESGLSVDEVFTRANEELCDGNEAEMFVTCWMGMLNLSTGNVKFCNAGHNPPVLSRNGVPIKFFRSRPNMVLGGMEGIRYRLQELDLEPQDTLFLYTDGVTEATDTSDQLFEEERLLHCLDEHRQEDVSLLCQDVYESVNDFVGEAPQFDDITVLALRYYGKESR